MKLLLLLLALAGGAFFYFRNQQIHSKPKIVAAECDRFKTMFNSKIDLAAEKVRLEGLGLEVSLTPAPRKGDAILTISSGTAPDQPNVSCSLQTVNGLLAVVG